MVAIFTWNPMLTLQERLNKLSPDERAQLDYAFEEGVTDFIRTKDEDGKLTRYVGVFADRSPALIPDQVAGAWSAGKIKT